MTDTTIQSNTLKREIFCFIVAGILATLTDFTLYWLLHPLLSYSIAKAVSFLIGSVVAYLLNKFFTFKKYQRSTTEIVRFILLYASTLVANVAVNSFSIFVLTIVLLPLFNVSEQTTVILAFLAATGVSTILNFLGQRLWVFNVRSKS